MHQLNLRTYSDDKLENLFIASKKYIKPFQVNDYTLAVMPYLANLSINKIEISYNGVILLKHRDSLKKAVIAAQKGDRAKSVEELSIFFSDKQNLHRKDQNLGDIVNILGGKTAVFLLFIIESLKDCLFKKYVYNQFLSENRNNEHLSILIKKVMNELDYLRKKKLNLSHFLNNFYLDFFLEEEGFS